MLRLLFVLLVAAPLHLFSAEAENSILVYGGGNVQVEADIDDYQVIVTGTPITGTVMVTHDKKAAVDQNSFRIGDKRLLTKFVQMTQISDYNPLVVSIYSFELEGMAAGQHTLPPIKVKVSGKEYSTQPITVQIAEPNASY